TAAGGYKQGNRECEHPKGCTATRFYTFIRCSPDRRMRRLQRGHLFFWGRINHTSKGALRRMEWRTTFSTSAIWPRRPLNAGGSSSARQGSRPAALSEMLAEIDGMAPFG